MLFKLIIFLYIWNVRPKPKIKKGPQYDRKCDICNKSNPEKNNTVVHDNQNGAISTKYYCLDCFKKELHG